MLCLGCLFVGLGTMGIWVPVMPSTIFFILALWAFKKSSPRMEAWLLRHPIVGPTLRDWDENGSVKPRTKVLAIGLIWLSIGASIAFLVINQRPVWVPIMLFGIAVALTIYLLTRPSAPSGASMATIYPRPTRN